MTVTLPTYPLPSKRDEAFRYSDVDALRVVEDGYALRGEEVAV
jgi:hypothetical protein